jgi:hypothetical protein
MVGTVTTGEPDTFAMVSITGTAPNQFIDFTIPQGDTGPATVLSIGTVTTGLPGGNALVSVTGTAPSQTLDLAILSMLARSLKGCQVVHF